MKIEYSNHYGSDFIEIENEVGFKVILSSVGAGIYQLSLNGNNFLSTPKDLKTYVNPNEAYYGKTVGPICGRVKDGIVKVGNKINHLPLNEGENSLHSGSICFASIPFKYEVTEIEDCTEIIFTYFFKGIEGVFDASMDISITYKVAKDKPMLEYSYSLVPSLDCPINMTNHCYFNLNGKGDILGHELTIPASKSTCYDENLIVKGILDVTPTLDFRKTKKVGKDIHAKELSPYRLQGYDHCFICDDQDYSKIKATLVGDKYGLNLYTDSEGIQVYTCNFPKKEIKLASNEYESQYSSITLEEVNAPRGLDSMVIKAGSKFSRHHKYEFFEKENENA